MEIVCTHFLVFYYYWDLITKNQTHSSLFIAQFSNPTVGHFTRKHKTNFACRASIVSDSSLHTNQVIIQISGQIVDERCCSPPNQVAFVQVAHHNGNDYVEAEQNVHSDKHRRVFVQVAEFGEHCGKVDCVRWHIKIRTERSQMVAKAFGGIVYSVFAHVATVRAPFVRVLFPVFA